MTVQSQPSRWFILALLFLVRCCMGFQFQAVPAVSPLFLSTFGVTAADIGLLIGLYHAPGMALAIPGGGLGARYGDKPVVALGLVLMLAGGVVMAASGLWSMQLLGRLVAGTGGVLLNVAMSKMVTDWFAGREIATAMGIFVNSWPVGVALGLVAHPLLAGSGGLLAVHAAVGAVVLLGLAGLLTLYPAPSTAAIAGAPKGKWPRGLVLAAVLTAGLVWGLYNAALGVVFGFGPLALTERGQSIAAAAATISIVLWGVALSVPAGGIVADRIGRPVGVLIVSCIGFAATMALALRVEAIIPVLVALALVGGLAAGPIMSLPSRVLSPETRALGMGLFFTVFYAMQLIGPWLSGIAAARAGTAAITFDVGATMLIGAIAATGVFLLLADRVKAGAAPQPISSGVKR